MSEKRTIPKEISDEYGKDYAFLRATGLEYIESLAGKLWTDYNTHDPGVTMLEMLCYAITDLGYRISMPMEDILAKPKDNLRHMHEQFLSALRVLPSRPVSADDYRRLFVRIKGVRNCWIHASDRRIVVRFKNFTDKANPELHYKRPEESINPLEQRELRLQGLNDILLDYDEDVLLGKEGKGLNENTRKQLIAEKKQEVDRRVREVYHRFRNLCEDMDSILEVPLEGVVICGDIDIAPNADPEEVWARIVFNIDQYLAPDIPFHTLQEMQEMGETTERIFEGPVFAFGDRGSSTDRDKLLGGRIANQKDLFVKKGFIRREDMENSELRTEVRLSDIIRVIMNTDGVRLVKDIAFGLCDKDGKDKEKVRRAVAGDKWNLCINPGHKPVFCRDGSVLNLWKGFMPIELKMDEAQVRLNKLRDERNRQRHEKVVEDLPMPEGRYRRIGNYQSFQNDFPGTYGIGRAGLSDGVPTRRKAQARQLKGYLLFFEQVLANYFAQLEQVGVLFAADNSIGRTYFAGVVKGIKDVEKIFPGQARWQKEIEELLDGADEPELDPYVRRKNMFLDHLLARFAEQFNEYVFLMYRIYGDDAERAIIRHKVEYLKEYDCLSACRGSGFDYCNPLDKEQMRDNVSGMEKRISKLLGFNHYRREPLADLSYEVVTDSMLKSTIKGVDTKVRGYGWVIRQRDDTILYSLNNKFIKDADVYEQISLASLLGCEQSSYQPRLSSDKRSVSFILVDSSGAKIAGHPKQYPVTAEELQSGDYAELNKAIEAIMHYLLTEFRLEGMHVVEHLLLRPDFNSIGSKNVPFLPVCIEPDGSFCPPLDPYSFRVTVILPGYSLRLRNRYFRQFAERLIRMETPAHVLPRVCFVSEEHMRLFETAYHEWLTERSGKGLCKQAADKTLKKLIEVLGTIYTIYEEGRLTDCDDDTPDNKPIVLGRSMLGSLQSDS